MRRRLERPQMRWEGSRDKWEVMGKDRDKREDCPEMRSRIPSSITLRPQLGGKAMQRGTEA